MNTDTPEPLWRSVVGDTEPWRRGRWFLIGLAVWSLISQSVSIGEQILLGRVELVLTGCVGALVYWLLFYFIWIGVHWTRWITGGFTMLVAFANLIWGMRDGNAVRIVNGTVSFPIGAYLALAPAVYFFAVRQKSVVRWKEAVVVAAVFAMLFVSFGAGIIALLVHKIEVEKRGRAFAETAFRRLFFDGDVDFLKKNVTARAMAEEGWPRLSWFMADRYLRLGPARSIGPARGHLRFWFRFPARLGSEGIMSTEAESDHGPVRLHLLIGEGGGHWQIDGIWWQYVHPSATPPR